jgi:hypothetical protein
MLVFKRNVGVVSVGWLCAQLAMNLAPLVLPVEYENILVALRLHELVVNGIAGEKHRLYGVGSRPWKPY